MLHKYLYGGIQDPTGYGLKFLQYSAGTRRTRTTDSGLLEYPTSVKMGYRKSPLYRGIELWNLLNALCRQMRDKDTFKAKIKPRVKELFMEKLLKR